MSRGVVAAACALACLGWPAAAHGAEASTAQLRALASSALHDPAALERLRAIDVVDGRRVELAAILRGSDDDVRARLRVLASAGDAPAAPATQAGRARDQARDVLAQRRFHSSSVPAPLRSVRERIGKALRSIGRPFADAFDWVADRLPGGVPALAVLLAAAVLATAVALATRAGARRRAAGGGRGPGGAGAERVSAAELRRQAADAERRGELDLALRLRFRAGLVDLDARELVELRPALTNHELLQAVPSATLAQLVDGFEAVAYGGRPAAADDLRSARDGWPRVPEEARGS